MCRELLKNPSCEQCTHGLAVSLIKSDHPEASLVNLKTKGKLVHPAIHIFRMLQSAESVFQKKASKRSAYCLTIDELLEQHNFSFPCPLHKVDVVAHVLQYYVSMRMRQYAKQKRSNSSKSRSLRKLAKLA
ncbi:hypothetical protein HPB49_013462 [Dermacentor silvarum]|uniref:Uncharacterized protein n=1 Tax=Dermacentor silvarum TaxID=543639 RepID=A0ACB8CRM2_DERSI|nr:hypothetical protein HPB49_013462 [Dermacentor silvarum]